MRGKGFGGRHDEDGQSGEGSDGGRDGGIAERGLERGEIGFEHGTGEEMSFIRDLVGVEDQGAVVLIVES